MVAIVAVAAATAIGIIVSGHTPPQPQRQWRSGAEQVAEYAPSQVRGAERILGYGVVEPMGAVRAAAGLPLTAVLVTKLMGWCTIHYVFGNLTRRWVTVMETRQALTSFSYDAGAQAVTFAVRGRGITVATNLSPAAVDLLVQRLGGPPDAVPGPVA